MGMLVNSVLLTLALTEEKLVKIKDLCQKLLNNNQTTVLELTKLVGMLSSTCQAVLLARLQFRYLQNLQIQALKQGYAYGKIIVITKLAQIELSTEQNSEL